MTAVGRGPAAATARTWPRLLPSRQLLLKVYAACHGEGCLLQKLSPGVISSERRAATAVDLWRRLTGDTTSTEKELMKEALSAQRKHSMVGTPSTSHRRWLESPLS